ncbi:glycosyltransferase family 4 protein [bacterium]|nr:glycosyltransferase family 4 protein [bacterium]
MERRLCIVNLYARALFQPAVAAPFGGSEVQMAGLARAFARRPGWRVSMVVGDFGQPPREEIEGITFIRSVRVGQLNLLARLLNSRRYLRAFREADADLYLITADAGTLIWRLARFCRRHGRRLVNRVSSDSYADAGFLSDDPVRAHLYERALRQCDLVVAQNAGQVVNLRELFGVYAVTVNALGPPVLDEAEQPQRRHVLWVGRARRMKRPELFMELAEALPHQSFVMILSPDEPDFAETVERAARLVHNLTLVPGVPPSAMRDYYLSAKVLVNTSDYEGFPSTFVEAFCAGVPVVSLHADPDELLSRQELGCCARGDMDDLVAGVRKLVENSQHWRQVSLRALEYARQHYDPERVVARYEELFKLALEKGKRP